MDKLWDVTIHENIYVSFEKLWTPENKLLGLYLYRQDTGSVITLDKKLLDDRRLLRCVLSEEIGHFYTAPSTNLLKVYGSHSVYGYNSEIIKMAQVERRALQWATDFLISDAKLCRALSEGYRSCFELAEYFDVTEWFIRRKLLFIKKCFRHCGIKVKGRDLFDMEIASCLTMCEGGKVTP